ncbi:MAG: MazG nucleotide pyrophosphohydrolase domain-containing protein, partial [Hyphomicrobiales bacterium]
AESRSGTHERISEEFGDVLFVVANLARRLKIDPEAALVAANAKFRRRFGRVEAMLADGGKRPEESTLEEMDALWEAVKAEEREQKKA